MLFTRRRWIVRVVEAAGLRPKSEVGRMVSRVLMDCARQLSADVQIDERTAVLLSAAILPVNVLATCAIAEALEIETADVDSLAGAVARAAWTVVGDAGIDGLVGRAGFYPDIDFDGMATDRSRAASGYEAGLARCA